MTCDEARERHPGCPDCCSSCHHEAEDGFSLDVEMGWSPCCTITDYLTKIGVDPYEVFE